MRKYTFAFDALTIGNYCDLVVASNLGDVPSFIRVMDKCCPGVRDLPMLELNNVIQQFLAAFKQYTDETPAASRLLRQALGEQD